MGNDLCQQDAIVLGYESNMFGGYGTRINNVTFSRIRTCITMGPGCNGVLVSNILIAQTCGNSNTKMGAIYIDRCKANWIMNVVAEPHAYSYLVTLGDAKFNRFDNLQVWDTSLMNPMLFKKVINFDSGEAIDNIFNNIYLDGLSLNQLSSDNSHMGRNNTCNNWNMRSLPHYTAQSRADHLAPSGSMCIGVEDGSLWLLVEGVWVKMAKA